MRVKPWCVLIVSVLLLLPASGQGQEIRSLTLAEALELARERNPDLLAARREREVAQGRLVKARYPNPFNPEIGGEVTNRSRGEPGEVGNTADFAVTLSQELEVAGQRSKRIEEAERNIEKVSQQVRDAERVLTAQVKEVFYQALSRKRRLDLFGQVESLNRRLQEIAAARFQAGEVPKMEVNLAEIRLGQARKGTIVAERDYRNTLRALERLVGLEPKGEVEPVGQLTVQPKTFQLADLVRLALEGRPDLRASTEELRRIDAESALTRRLIVPNPTLSFVYREEERRDRIAGAVVSIPLPVFDRKQAELLQLAGRKDQAGYERQSVELRVRQEVGDALRAYDAAKAEVAVFETAVLERATENFQLMETAYREGKIDLLQVIVVQNDLVNAQFSYIDSLENYWQARTALERAIGQDL